MLKAPAKRTFPAIAGRAGPGCPERRRERPRARPWRTTAATPSAAGAPAGREDAGPSGEIDEPDDGGADTAR